jgi:hypothetical protein
MTTELCACARARDSSRGTYSERRRCPFALPLIPTGFDATLDGHQLHHVSDIPKVMVTRFAASTTRGQLSAAKEAQPRSHALTNSN